MAGAIPNAKILVDTWHLARSGGTVADLLALPPGCVGGAQLSDRIAPPPGEPYVPMTGRSIPGDGELPLVDIVRALHANQPGLDICMEVFSAEIEAMSHAEAAQRMAEAARTVVSAALPGSVPA
jgi:sugar phosphate isomerase/epimerase